uniref:V-SNARE coiled-coil homology domain-containing protein n=1 Tax=Chromera velia CCMP2878 TaxID=1169474 RepID=A0A0G4IDK5_9ALVE|eukprot:Cvel_13308.t1-p1 / transcript=Cvel_13308.t1 / gene=Cvel_13308 / organism=Chromera_velia_CCMP2878 / gene_product=Vesicle-associated membrane protein 721, putative / transcript_product=Vesicle-associated membrane protein 721, putative / location=Cvel_scaffold903:24545-28008(-) / protein_length=278 / sequence_SO=supercontig / SO=protein_coding / is_pseudo=false
MTFLGVGRARDQSILASAFDKMTNSEKNEIEATFTMYLNEALNTFAPGSREKRFFGDGCMYLLADRDMTCIYAIGTRNTSYPERHAFAALADLMKAVTSRTDGATLDSCAPGSITRTVRKELREIMEKFDRPQKFDKTAEVSKKVDDAKDVMQDNVKKMLQTHHNLETLENKTTNLQGSAAQFNTNANTLKRQMWMRNLKLTLILIVVIIAIVLWITIPIAIKANQKGGNRRLLRGVLPLLGITEMEPVEGVAAEVLSLSSSAAGGLSSSSGPSLAFE